MMNLIVCAGAVPFGYTSEMNDCDYQCFGYGDQCVTTAEMNWRNLQIPQGKFTRIFGDFVIFWGARGRGCKSDLCSDDFAIETSIKSALKKKTFAFILVNFVVFKKPTGAFSREFRRVDPGECDASEDKRKVV